MTNPTRDDVRRAEEVARDMALESQNLTDSAYQARTPTAQGLNGFTGTRQERGRSAAD